MLHLLLKVKNVYMSVSPTNVKMNTWHLRSKFKFCFAPQQSPPPPPTPTQWGEWGATV